jgi:hypothetical protein
MVTALAIFAWVWGLGGAAWNMYEVFKDPFYVLNSTLKRNIFLIYIIVTVISTTLAINQYESYTNHTSGKMGGNKRCCSQKQKEIQQKA